MNKTFDPRDAEATALRLLQGGRPDQAELCIRQALQKAPNYAPLLKLLGQCRIGYGDFLSALDCFQKAVRVDSGDAQAHFALGTVLRKLHRLREALASLQESARLSGAPQPLLELADLQIGVGQAEAAVESCSKAIDAAPGDFHANVLMARALCELGRFDEAVPYWAAAQLKEPVPGQVNLAKAMYLANNGLFAEARQEAVRAIELGPTRGRPYYALFASGRVTKTDQPYINQIESVLERRDVPPSDRVDLLYALGKAYDNLGEYEKAMMAFDQANAVQKKLLFQGRPFDRNQLRSMVDAQIRLLNKPVPSEFVGSDRPEPIFVVGMARSGTTLVDQILSSHPKIGSVGEQSFWLDYQHVALSSKSTTRGYYEDLLSLLAPGFPFVVDKNPTNIFVVGLLCQVFPNAKIICTRRSAVDTALSIWTTQMHTEAPFVCDRDNIVFAYKECLRLMEHCRQAIPADRYLEVSYESLAQDPEAGARQMLDFLGLEWDEACLHPEQNARSVSTPSFWQVRQPVYKTSIERWRSYEPWLGSFRELIGL